MTRKLIRFATPVLIIALGIVVVRVMVATREPAATRVQEPFRPTVRVIALDPTDHRFVVTSEGTVTPRTEIAMVAELSGRITSVSSALAAGGFFKKGDVLASIESLDYEAALERARVTVRQAERRVAEEEALADIAEGEWERIGDGEEATPLTRREPQLAEARAQLASAQKALAQARRDLDRTQVRAPFTGRIRDKNIGVGQYVTRGAPIANIYAVDFAEVRLPIAPEDLAFADLPVGYVPAGDRTTLPPVSLQVRIAGSTVTWEGWIDRTEGEIDPRTRLLYAVARVEDPYGFTTPTDHPPLAAGLFVNATIEGRMAENVLLAPRMALRGDRLVVIDTDNRLRLRPVTVLRIEGEIAVLESGLQPGDRVCVSVMETVVEGTEVIPVDGRLETEGATPEGDRS